MILWNSGCLYTTDPCVQTMHTQKNLPDFRRKYRP